MNLVKKNTEAYRILFEDKEAAFIRNIYLNPDIQKEFFSEGYELEKIKGPDGDVIKINFKMHNSGFIILARTDEDFKIYKDNDPKNRDRVYIATAGTPKKLYDLIENELNEMGVDVVFNPSPKVIVEIFS